MGDALAREQEAACPPWCAGHLDSYQAWEVGRDGVPERGHAEEVRDVVPGVSVEVSQVERIDGRGCVMQPARVVVWTGLDSADLSPFQARELSAALLTAAERAEVAP